MAWFEAVLLGILQGLTEFLPVSSSGHMVIAKSFMPDLKTPGLLFEVLTHGGTLAAVILVFRKELLGMIRSLLPDGDRASRMLIVYIVAATIPTGLIGFLFKDFIHGLFQSVTVVAVMLLVTGLFLWLSDILSRPTTGLYKMGIPRAIAVGLAQSVALVPGISRSGATISAGRLLGVAGEDAARFGFLISIPAVMGAVILETNNAGPMNGETIKLCLAGTVAAFLAGIASLNILMAVVRKSKLRWFAAYCWVVGLATLAMGH